MWITFDAQANAMYLSFTWIPPGEAVFTIPDFRTLLYFDEDDQWTRLDLLPGDELDMSNCLAHIGAQDGVRYEEATNTLTIQFQEDRSYRGVVQWNALVDFDQEGQLLGIELLFGDRLEKIQGKLRYVYHERLA